MVQDFHFKNMLPPAEVLPDGVCESKALMKDLAGQFAKSTGETIAFDVPRRSLSDGLCILAQHPHPYCQATACPSGEECKKLWTEHFGIAYCSQSIAQWQCPGENTALIGSVHIDAHLLYIGKVVLRPRSEKTSLPLIRNAMHGTLREMALTIQNSILKQQLGASAEIRQPRRKTESPEHPAISHAVEFINEHYHSDNLSLSSVADAVGINPSYLSSLFHTATGRTFHDHVANLRLDNAKELMENTHLTLSEIAWRCGFATPRNLRRALQQAAENGK